MGGQLYIGKGNAKFRFFFFPPNVTLKLYDLESFS